MRAYLDLLLLTVDIVLGSTSESREQGRAECRCGTFSSGGCRHVVWYEASHLSHISMLGACSSRAVQHIWVAHTNQPHSGLKNIPELVERHTRGAGSWLVAWHSSSFIWFAGTEGINHLCIVLSKEAAGNAALNGTQ